MLSGVYVTGNQLGFKKKEDKRTSLRGERGLQCTVSLEAAVVWPSWTRQSASFHV